MNRLLQLGLLLLSTVLVGCPQAKFECDSATPCAFGQTCKQGMCQDVACATSAQCPINQYCTTDRKCVDGCEADSDCEAGFTCDTENQTCVPKQCQSTDTDCGYKEFCNPATGECYTAGGDFCKPCDPQANDCAADNVCWAGYCAVNCDNNRECPSGFQCVPFSDSAGHIVSYQCITYCWLYEGYDPGTFLRAPEIDGPLPLHPKGDARKLLGPILDRPEAP